MRADWDRRIAHDYRFWMSDGHQSDEAMWTSGERDFSLITRELGETSNKTVLDLGCGVGRLMKAARSKFAKVIGIDISERAVTKARELLGNDPGISLIVGDGFSLSALPTGSVDVVVSFAALVSMPAEVTARYLVEFHRVLNANGMVRLQVYLGKEQSVTRCNTLHLRAFDRENFIRAVQSAGFGVQWIEELKLPFEVSFKESGLEAMIVSLVKEPRQSKSYEEVYTALLPHGEPEELNLDADANLEYWMSINYASALAEKGDFERARETLEYSATVAKNATIDVRDLLGRIVAKIEDGERAKGIHAIPEHSEWFGKNRELLEKRFPEIAARVFSDDVKCDESEIRETLEGRVVYFKGQCLDHPQRPKAAGESWAKRMLHESRSSKAGGFLIVGCGAGYHIDALLTASKKPCIVIEPSLQSFRVALGARDLSVLINGVEALYVGEVVPSPIASDTELFIRPQHLAMFSAFASRIKSSFYSVRGISSLHPTIGVLGPLQGGTLPITAYTVRALRELGQHTREFDTSGFAGGFHNVENLLFDKYRVAGVQSAYIDMVSKVIYEAINEKPVDILVCMAQAPVTVPLLLELRKKGIILVLWFLEDYLRFTYWKDYAKYYDFVFTIQNGECLSAIKAAGAGEVHYLPPGCDPAIHAPITPSQDDWNRWGSPVSFVGAGYHNRQQMFAFLADLPFKIWGTEWPTCRPFDRMVQEQGRRLTPAEYVKIFNTTEINLNLHSSTERDGVEPNGDFVNPRTYELAASNAFQLVDERTLLPGAFVAGKEVATFKDIHDLRDKIQYYRDHPEERKAIAAAGRQRALRDHTYVHRMKEMLALIYNSKYEHLKRREDESPWTRMKLRAAPHKELAERCEEAFKRGEQPMLDGLVADIVSGKGKLTPTEQKLLFLFHVRKQIIRFKVEELGTQAPEVVRRGGM